MKTLTNHRRLGHLAYANAGFTLLEIMLVVMIIALLAGSAIYLMKDSLGFAKDTRVRADIQALDTMVLTYQNSNGNPPSTAQGLDALVNKPAGEPVPRRWVRLMSELPLDPWGAPYVLETPGARSGKDYDIFSKGPDHTAHTDDDLGSWQPN